MAMSHVTVREAAELAGVTRRVIEKAAEEGIVAKEMMADSLRKKPGAHVLLHVVTYATALKRAEGLHLDLPKKKEFFRYIVELGDALGAYDVVPGVRFAVDELASEEWSRARRYVAAKEAHLESREDILGGEPVIKGTRITCRSVLGRIEGGDTIDDLCDDYEDIPPAAFEASVIYARTHPPRGRPAKGKPWRG